MRHLLGTLRSRDGGALTIMGVIGRNGGEEYTDGECTGSSAGCGMGEGKRLLICAAPLGLFQAVRLL